jgi:hypothetical protein
LDVAVLIADGIGVVHPRRGDAAVQPWQVVGVDAVERVESSRVVYGSLVCVSLLK